MKTDPTVDYTLTVLRERLKIPTLTARMSGAVVGIVCSDQLSRGLRAW